MHRTLLLTLGAVLPVAAVAAQQPAPQAPASAPRVIRGMRYPAISPDGSRIVFSYRGDLWTVSAAGGEARRLAERAGWDVRARWSPDGQSIAFSSDASGNMDLYTIPATGGTAKQITSHSADDTLGDWSPDGKRLLFYSSRDSRVPILWSIGVEDGRLRELTRDDVTLQSPTESPDGKWVAYARGRGEWARKGFRGSSTADLWLLSLAKPGTAPRRLTTFAGNDMWPMFTPDGKSVYYTCDADGTGNLWKVSLNGGKPSQVTRQRDGYIHYPSLARSGKALVYETDFSLWVVDPTARGAEPRRLTVTASVDDQPRTETRTLSAARIEELEVSPDGTQLAVGMRGDIFIVPAEGGDARRVTDSLARDYDFEWSADGRSLLYVSEREANQDLYLLDVASGASRRLTTNPEPESNPQFSPDGRSIAFLRGTSGPEICVMPATGGPEKTVVKGAFLSGPRWSPDSRWLAYSRRTEASLTDVYVAPAAGGQEVNVSHWTGANSNPVWSPDGTRLFFFSSRSGSMDILAADLTRRKPAAAAPAAAPAPASGNSASQGGASGGPASGAPAPATAPETAPAIPTDIPQVTIEAEGISKRVRPLAGGTSGQKLALAFTPDRKSALFTVVTPTTAPEGRQGGPGRGRGFGGGFGGGGFGAQSVLYSVPVTGGTPTKVAEGIQGSMRPTKDGTAIFTFSAGRIRKVVLPAGTATDVSFKASYDVDLKEERRQAFDQAWRLMRDSFYDPQMHGADWNGVRARYRPIVDECSDVKDFHLLLTEMIGELNASHTGASAAGGFTGRGPGGPPGGGENNRAGTANLGVWFDWNRDGAGLKVTQVLREGPADTDETRIKPGEYVLAVAGQDVTPTETFVKSLSGKAGQALEVLVNGTPDKQGARTVKLTPVSTGQFSNLLYEQWVQNNRERVDRLSGGKFAYLHIKAMDQPSLERFERELYTEAYNKEGLVLDVRNNGGGRIHDELFALLAKKVHVYETPRGGLKMTQPFGAFPRPMILLINHSSFSDAEIFPNGFRANGLGKLVGVPTGGGVIGTSDQVLLDNQTRFRVPRTGWYALDGRNLERWGVPPDFYVDLTPADYLAGQDPQIERATEELLKENAQAKKRASR